MQGVYYSFNDPSGLVDKTAQQVVEEFVVGDGARLCIRYGPTRCSARANTLVIFQRSPSSDVYVSWEGGLTLRGMPCFYPVSLTKVIELIKSAVV